MANSDVTRNCLLSVANYGGIFVTASRVVHGVSIVGSQAAAARHRSFHPWRQTSGSCTLTIKHTSYDDYVQFNEWMKVYYDTISSPDGQLGPMRIYIPAIKFDRLGIPSSPLMFGQKVGDIVWTQNLAFKGASDPTDNSGLAVSTVNVTDAFQPWAIGFAAGVTLSNAEDRLYNPSLDAANIPSGFGEPGF